MKRGANFWTSVLNEFGETYMSLEFCHSERSSLLNAGSNTGKEMFHLMTHSTHFIYSYMVSAERWKQHRKGNVSFNDTLNTFYLVIWRQLKAIQERKCFI